MKQTPREVMLRAISFDHPERIPFAWGPLPWAEEHYPDEVSRLRRLYPNDVIHAPAVFTNGRRRGEEYGKGKFTDEWGCTFDNLLPGIIGEVKEPLISELADWEKLAPPYDTIPADEKAALDRINAFCHSTDLAVRSNCAPRPWERYQFIRGTENAMIDAAMQEPEFFKLLNRIHQYYLAEFEFWAKSDVDILTFMDDWGSQSSLLISPESWRKIFKPLYADYCRIAREHGKLIQMHSDGNITAILPDLAEIGVNALNSQLFSMDFAEIAPAVKGKICLWGEIDRQNILTSANPSDGSDAVEKIFRYFGGENGGIIANLEFGPGADPATVETALAAYRAAGNKINGQGA